MEQEAFKHRESRTCSFVTADDYKVEHDQAPTMQDVHDALQMKESAFDDIDVNG